MAGDFGQIAKASVEGAVEFIERLHLKPGTRVLDVACGTGNLALPAARAGAVVTGVDIAPNLLEQARQTAEREGLQAQFDEGDAEHLPYDDASFDVVVTMFGAMFAPRPNLVAAELKRVCRSGGLIAMGNWTPTGFVGRMFKTVSNHVPPLPGFAPPVLWGVESTVQERLDGGIEQLKMTRRTLPFHFPLPPFQVVEHFRKYFGPAQEAFRTLDDKGREALRSDLETLWIENNLATDGTTTIEGEYLEVIAIRS